MYTMRLVRKSPFMYYNCVLTLKIAQRMSANLDLMTQFDFLPYVNTEYRVAIDSGEQIWHAILWPNDSYAPIADASL